MDNFWTLLRKPILALAPLSGITDSAFRRICKGLGADIVYSELTSSTALAYHQEASLRAVRFDESERPFIVQLFGNDPDHFAAATRMISREIKPDGIDINFGCPIPKVFKKGAGAALMTNLPLAKEVILSVIENTKVPVSIKTRTSVKEVDLLTFLDYVGDLDIKAIMVHGRSYAQGFSGPNDIDTTRAVRRRFRGIVLANGGVNTAEQGLELLRETGADGLGLARGARGNPWIFQQLKTALAGNGNGKPTSRDVFMTAMEHARLATDSKGERGIIQMRKHLCWYLQQVPGTKKLRQKAVAINNLQDVVELLSQTD